MTFAAIANQNDSERADRAAAAVNAREAARLRAGLTLDGAAKQARVSPAYLRAVERSGGASFGLAQRLSAIYGNGCRIEAFLADSTARATAAAAATSGTNRTKTKGARASLAQRD